MAYNNGPRIVTDGLVLTLDAGNTKSYAGSGTTWGDLSGNGNNGTLTNGPTFSSANGGSIVFDGVDDYAQFNVLSQISSSLSYSVCFNFYPTSIVTEKGVWLSCTSTNDRHGGKVVDNLFIFKSNNISLSCNIVVNKWQYICCVSNGATPQLYLDAVQNSTDVTANGSYNYFGYTTVGKIGGSNTNAGSTSFPGNISNIQIYNRALTANEIQQNFNATRGRFGV